jgi:hypothetical protein
MGKTRIGSYLASEYGYMHLDIEDHIGWPLGLPYFEPGKASRFMETINGTGQKAVITWGFWPGPDGHDGDISELVERGAVMFWLDGDRSLAKKSWKMARPCLDERLFDAQIQRIDAANIQQFSPIPFNTFGDDGQYLDLGLISEKLFELANKKGVDRRSLAQ